MRFSHGVLACLSLILLQSDLAFSQVGQPLQQLPSTTLQTPRAVVPAVPRRITLEMPDAYIPVQLQGNGRLQLWAWFDRRDKPTSHVGAAVMNLCTMWEIHPKNGYPGATSYQFRPHQLADYQWQEYILQIDVPNLMGGPAGSAWIVPKNFFGSTPPPAQKFPMQPATTITYKKSNGSTLPQPDWAQINFPKAVLEFNKDTGKVQLRAGNLILVENRGGYWRENEPGKFMMGPFRVDVNTKLVDWWWKSQWWPIKASIQIEQDTPGTITLQPGALAITKYWK